MPRWRVDADGSLILNLLVVPRSSRCRFGPLLAGSPDGDLIKVAVMSAPVDGAANTAVIELIAKTFSLPRSSIEIVRGATSRRKTCRIQGLTSERVEALLTR